ncbi:RNA-binding domain-containing protein [Methanolobus sp. ZRKC3]|uniref:RNA-binding domain-containing protein n=1 Tax=Methanolobus sp. ZRKC3 TaxID=3125786 RepID=UPI00324E3E3E
MIKVQISVDVNPTEDEGKVREAVSNIFPDIELEAEPFGNVIRLSGEGDISALANLHYLIREETIIDTSRTRLNVGMDEEGKFTYFTISKQVATVGRLNYPAQKEALGSIRVFIDADSAEEMERFVEWLTPPTEDGVPDFEIEMSAV